jgi:hypothetical protein
MLSGIPLPAGAIRTVVVPNPAPYDQWNYTFPDGYESLLLGLRYTFMTDNVAFNRYFGLMWWEVVCPYELQVRCAVPIPALQTCTGVWMAGCSFVETVSATLHQMTLPYPLVFKPGDELHSSALFQGIGDQLSDIFLYYLEMPLTQ